MKKGNVCGFSCFTHRDVPTIVISNNNDYSGDFDYSLHLYGTSSYNDVGFYVEIIL